MGLMAAAFVSGTLFSSDTVTAEKGGPFAEVWEAIFGLQTQMGTIEQRLDVLENPPFDSNVFIQYRTSVPGCEKTNECYIPYQATIQVKDELTWTNADSSSHTVTSGSPGVGPSGEFESGKFKSAKTFSHIFDSEGRFSYYCTLHPWMAGVVVVVGENL